MNKENVKMKKSITTLNAFFLFLAASIGSSGIADTGSFKCRNGEESARINIVNDGINVQMNGTSCHLDSKSEGLETTRNGTYRVYSAGESFCQWGDRFDLTTIADIRVSILADNIDLSRPVIFNFGLSSDTGGYLTFLRKFFCTREEG